MGGQLLWPPFSRTPRRGTPVRAVAREARLRQRTVPARPAESRCWRCERLTVWTLTPASPELAFPPLGEWVLAPPLPEPSALALPPWEPLETDETTGRGEA